MGEETPKEKRCSKCKNVKPLSEFHANKYGKDKKRSYCNICSNAAARKWQNDNPERHKENRTKWQKKNPQVDNERLRTWRLANPIENLIRAAKKRAKKNGLSFNIEHKDFLSAPGICPVLGIPLVYGGVGNARDPDLASLDRIDNNKGYVKGNVVLVSLRANCIKRDATLEELKALVRFYDKV